MDKHYQLSIIDDNTSVNVDTVDPEALTRILALAGLPAPTPSVPPPVSTISPQSMPSTSTPMNTSALNAIEVPFTVGDDNGDMGYDDYEVDDECNMGMTGDEEIGEVADFDLANQDNKPAGHELAVLDYEWSGPHTPQRQVKGMQGDNPLITEFHKSLINKYQEYLFEDEDEYNEDGQLSPLSDPTKPEFDKDPTSNEDPIVDGSRSPFSRIVRQSAFK